MIDTKSLTEETKKTVKEICNEMGFNYMSFLNSNCGNRLSYDKIIKPLEKAYKVEFIYSEELDKLYCYNSLITGTIDCPDEVKIGNYIYIKECNEVRKVIDTIKEYGENWFIVDKPFRYDVHKDLSNRCHLGMIKNSSKRLFDFVKCGDMVNGYIITEVKKDKLCTNSYSRIIEDGQERMELVELLPKEVVAYISSEKLLYEMYINE